MFKKLFPFALLLALFAAVAPTFAQGTTTFTISESSINSSTRVVTPPNSAYTGISVDLQPGVVVVNGTYTAPRTSTPITFSTNIVPTVANGTVTWTATTAITSAGSATQATIDRINAFLAQTWRAYFRATAGDALQSITITASDITYTRSNNSATGASPSVVVGGGSTTVTLSEGDAQTNISTRRNTITVDFQTNQVSLTGNISVRGTTYTGNVILTGSVQNGGVLWAVSSATVNGQAATADQLARINTSLTNVWNTWWNNAARNITITSLSITDSSISYTGTAK